jgi:hypothetical protein
MRLTIAALALAANCLLPASISAQDQPFTNADVVALSKAGIGDSLLIAKVNEAAKIDFKLDTEGILALHRDGVASVVVRAMVDRTAAVRRGMTAPISPPSAPIVPAYRPPTSLAPVGVMTAAGPVDIQPEMGTVSTAGFAFVQNIFLNFSGTKAARRTTIRDTPIYIRSEIDPSTSNNFTLVRLEVDADDKVRSLQLRRGGAFTTTSAIRPESNLVVPYTTEQTAEGIYRIRPQKALTPGEYGVMTTYNMIYAFGVD